VRGGVAGQTAQLLFCGTVMVDVRRGRHAGWGTLS